MTCRSTLDAVSKPGGGKPQIYAKGKRPKNLAEGYEALQLPCRQCIGCKIDKSCRWAIRMMLEANWLEEEHGLYSSFITLTYDDQHLPMHKSLVKDHLQKFIKKLRRRIEPHKISHYSVGEYGSQCQDHEIIECPSCGPLQRPHYHSIIFGWAFPDREMRGYRDGLPVYTSELLSKVWTFGGHEIGSCTFESCQYVAKYVTKKVTGRRAHDHYQRHIPETDQLVQIEPEFSHMSTRPAIARRWFQQYWWDCYPSDEIFIPGRYAMTKPPDYFDKLFEYQDPDLFAQIKEARREAMAQSLVDGPSLESRAIVQDAKLSLYSRKL